MTDVIINVIISLNITVKVFEYLMKSNRFFDSEPISAAQREDENNYVTSLILQAREGDQEAFVSLREKYKPLLESSAAKRILPDMTVQDIEDLKQEALIVFCNAVLNYEVENGAVEFGLYAKICIENSLVSFVRSYLRRQKKATLPLDHGQGEAEKEPDPLQRLVDKENAAELVRIIKSCLSDYEDRVWWLYVSGMSIKNISKEVGSDPKSVSNAVYRIRKKLRDYIGDRG